MDEIPGLEQIGIGFLFIIGGFLASLLTYILPFKTYIIFYGLVIAGAINILFGLFNLLRYFVLYTKFQNDMRISNKRKWKRLFNSILHSLIYIAKSDEVIDKNEISLIKDIMSKFTKITVPSRLIMKVSKNMDSNYLYKYSSIESLDIPITTEFKNLMVRASLAMIYLDGIVEKEEEHRFEKIISFFKISNEEVKMIMSDINNQQ